MTSVSRPSQDVHYALPSTVGTAAPCTSVAAMDPEVAGDLAKLAHTLLEDPIALQTLGDRVFELLQQDIRAQQERNATYRRQ